MSSKVRLFAFYLPQFHPIPENDQWWGKGFTEWTNVGKAKTLFKGHYQPRVPADLGYYDLRIPEVREQQARMAQAAGIEGFCYWHYWFGNGKRLLQLPFEEVLASGKPDFPFCLAWANESWKGFNHGLKNRNVLIEQQYPGEEDYKQHFYAVLPAFKDKRYITTQGKPVFLIYRPFELPDVKRFISLWQDLAIENGLKGIYFIGQTNHYAQWQDILNLSFDAVNIVRMTDFLKYHRSPGKKVTDKINRFFRKVPLVYNYEAMAAYFTGAEDFNSKCIPTIIPNWDHSPRSGREGLVMHNSSPELFGKHVNDVFSKIKQKPEELRIAFIKSWNEWGEGNYLEPDLKFGHQYLEVLKQNVNEFNNR
ncbi:glycoside hydrolase family 99-like domain-containing protein [Danxiaibacter flavus]|uniref:Glycoside hydrolase family 99-like domain-containing protein n=1 Tax=Danxiaibacter flavus TaxID=3049108 RepID=A0ABV3ZJ31_9BACT|nr:glycoside hydrolase family 99-like domain-containing protein [Chitinophagaceae bacterium DXS]